MTIEHQDNERSGRLQPNQLTESSIRDYCEDPLCMQVLTLLTFNEQQAASRLPVQESEILRHKLIAAAIKQDMRFLKVLFDHEGDEQAIWELNRKAESDLRTALSEMPYVVLTLESNRYDWEPADPDLEAIKEAYKEQERHGVTATFPELMDSVLVISLTAYLLKEESNLGKLVDQYLEGNKT
jgi:hypothetical protein